MCFYDTEYNNRGPVDPKDFLASYSLQQLINWLSQDKKDGVFPRQLLKTFAMPSFATGDDASTSLGIGGLNVQILPNGYYNKFGNANRFTDPDGGQTYSQWYVIDHLTGLGWYRELSRPILDWNNALLDASGSLLCGFSDWRLPNENELLSLKSRIGLVDVFSYGIFFTTQSSYWTSTATDPGNCISIDHWGRGSVSFTSNVFHVPLCRTHQF